MIILFHLPIFSPCGVIPKNLLLVSCLLLEGEEKLHKGDVFVLGGATYEFRYAQGLTAFLERIITADTCFCTDAVPHTAKKCQGHAVASISQDLVLSKAVIENCQTMPSIADVHKMLLRHRLHFRPISAIW